MTITRSILFLAFAVFLASIETSSTMPPPKKVSLENFGIKREDENRQELKGVTLTSLEQLFPGYNGVLPPYQIIRSQDTAGFHNFRKLGHLRMVYPEPPFFAIRDHIIMGWLSGDYITELCYCFKIHSVFVVYDTRDGQWHTLNEDDYHKLGPNRYFELVHGRDEVAVLHTPKLNRQIDQKAHLAACEYANREADRIEKEELKKLRSRETTIAESIKAIKKGYSDTYRSHTGM